MQNSRIVFIIIITSMALSACGYSLRGSNNLASSYSSLQLQLAQPASEFSRLLRRSIETAGVNLDLVTDDFVLTTPLLVVNNEQIVSRPVTVNARSRAAQYELRMSVSIALAADEAYVIEPETLVVQRIYFEDIENISGNREEVEIISAEMRRELVAQLIRRLEATKP